MSPLSPTRWLVTSALSRVVSRPYAMVGPYSTCESLVSLVVQVIVAAEVEMLEAATEEITGGVVSAGTPSAPILVIFATDGTPALFRMNSM